MTSFSLGTEFTGALQLPRYVNGRLLGAEDLTTDQSTLRTRDRWIGQAAGSGVVRGFEVTASATTLTVTPGLGINRNGEPISLTKDATLLLAIPLAEVAPKNPGRFACCDSGPSQTTGSVVASGLYVLTARPACRAEGSTATAAAPGSGSAGGCSASWTAAGVEFRVTSLPIESSVLGVEMTSSNRRNLVAHWCYGSDQLAELPADPFNFPVAYGLDRVSKLSDDDLPLAVFGWDGQTISDLDRWAVRRRVVLPEPSTDSWSVLTSDRHIADGQARFLQFQEQVAELVDLQIAGQTTAADVFSVLPPVGFLPVSGDVLGPFTQRFAAVREAGGAQDSANFQILDKAARAAARSGFNLQAFAGIPPGLGGVIDWTVAELLLRESWHRPPFLLSAAIEDSGGDSGGDDQGSGLFRRPGRRSERLFTYYFVWQNLLQLGDPGATLQPRPVVGFTFDRSSLYVVFVANYFWLGQALPPLVQIDNLIFKSMPTPAHVPLG
jgi:hypothetical protein